MREVWDTVEMNREVLTLMILLLWRWIGKSGTDDIATVEMREVWDTVEMNREVLTLVILLLWRWRGKSCKMFRDNHCNCVLWLIYARAN
jgi:hypothetical protein